MPAFESIVNEGDFVAEHFLTSDGKASFATRVATRAKEWREAGSSPLTRFTASRGDLESALINLGENPDDQSASTYHHELVLGMLGFTGAGYDLTHEPNVTRVASPGLGSAAPLAIVRARPADALEDLRDKDRLGLWEPFETADGKDSYALPTFVSTLFVEDDGPTFALIVAGQWMLLAEKSRWAEGRFLAVDLQLVAERNDTKRGGETETALTILAADSLAPDAEGDVWWSSVLEDSVKHTVGVSKDLREGVRQSIEIIANDVVSRRALQGLDPLPQSQAQPLAIQSLRYLYRILFLLYAEASPELGVLPAGAQEYDAGYSLDRLRELVLTELTSEDAATKTHLYDSLAVLFTLVDQGHVPHGRGDDEPGDALTFRSLSADLFQPRAIANISETKLSDAALKDVLERLLLSKRQGKKDRGFISYAELGINQLGAVYEGLMSYTGFFAEDDLYEVAKNGDGSKGSWVVPTRRADSISESDFVRTENEYGEDVPVVHRRGTFVYRLAGRERQQSASYYTPEVLTRFTVRQALEELLDQGGHTTTAQEILDLTVCEPALGSGAFAIEATRQLADEYLKRRQHESGETIAPEDYQRELQKVKAYIALHNVYGVDLNGTAVELAEISLWLDTMVAGLEAPWFGLHLRRGNSLIGARSAVYTRDAVNSRSWLSAAPADIARDERESHQIWHFLLPAEGWGAAAEAKEAKQLAPQALAKLKEWRKSIRRKPTKTQLEDLAELSYRVDAMWSMAAKRLEIANAQARRDIELWGRESESVGGAVTRAQIEESLADANGAYRRVKAVMDAWCALWFWPLEAATRPPSLDEWIATCRDILGRAPEARSRSRLSRDTLATTDSWEELNEAEVTDLGLAGAVSDATARERHPWLAVAREQVAQQGFFHWEFEFPQVFERGGFDLQVGNPPWVRPDWDEAAALGEFDARWALEGKLSTERAAELRESTLALEGARAYYLSTLSGVLGVREFVGATATYPILAGLRPDLYRCFMAQTWAHVSPHGSIALIHPETHFTDEKAGVLRSATYPRLRRHWQFLNELQLFDEVHHLVSYGVHTYGDVQTEVGFSNASNLYHPETVERSLQHDGSGEEPGLKGDDGKWDLRPHSSRIIHVDDAVLRTWHEVLESEHVPVRHSRMLYTVNRSVAHVLDKLAAAPRIRQMGLQFSEGWNETTDFNKGYFTRQWGTPRTWAEVILQGPHFHLGNPAYKHPNETMKHNQDWTPVDLEALPYDYIPITSYKPSGDQRKYDADYVHWGSGARRTPARNYYRIPWRRMAANTGERTLISAILPPGHAQLGTSVLSLGAPLDSAQNLVVAAASLSSLIADLIVRSAPKSNIFRGTVENLPCVIGVQPQHLNALIARTLKLNCVSGEYADLWNAALPDEPSWTPITPARTASERRQLQVEIDALVALGLGVTADELCTVYRTQFAVLRKYDQENHYDVNGRIVPNEVMKLYKIKGEDLTVEERTATHPGSGIAYTYELPFQVRDREADMRAAYAKFAEEFGSPA